MIFKINKSQIVRCTTMNCPDFIRLPYVIMGTYSSYFSEVRHTKYKWRGTGPLQLNTFTQHLQKDTKVRRKN